jgi:hypothetical protein
LYGVVVSEGLGLTEDDKVVREVVQRQAYELAPEDDKKILEYRFAKRMMYKVLDLDDAGFASDSSYAFGEYYQLSSKLFREENSKYVDEMVDFLLIGDLASRSLTPEIRRQFSALRVEYLGNISRALKSAEEKYKNDILGLLVDQLSYGSGLTEKYLLLKEISLEADDAIKAVVLGYEMSLLDSIRAKYIAIDTPEERKSFISSLYYSFDSNEDLLNEFLLKFKKGLSYDFNYELDTMSKGSVYIPPKALSMIDELRPHISEVEMESFIEEMRYRSFSEDEMVSHIERKMNQINFRAKTSHGVGVTYQQGGETKKANIPFLSTKKIKKKIVDDVVTEESVTSKVVDEVVTSEK